MKRLFTLIAALPLFFASIALATPTQEEVFRSIHQNVGPTVDVDAYIPYMVAIAAAIILGAAIHQRRQRPISIRRLNHGGKLLRELSRAVHLRSSEVKQLKLLAEEEHLQFPLTLLLCPSVLAKSLRSRNPKVDRLIMEQVIQRLRGGN